MKNAFISNFLFSKLIKGATLANTGVLLLAFLHKLKLLISIIYQYYLEWTFVEQIVFFSCFSLISSHELAIMQVD